MEADWSVEIGEGLPEIVVPWSAEGLAWIDLRTANSDYAAAVQDASLTAAQPALAAALERLHAADSAWFTSKCDAWSIDTEDEGLDPYEFDAAELASSEDPLHGCASYLDLIARDPAFFCSFAAHEVLLRSLAQALHALPHPCARVDLVLRTAHVHNADGFAITLYVAGCGLDTEQALQAWQRALTYFVATLHAAAL